MKKYSYLIIFVLLIICPKLVLAVDGLVCLYYKQGSAIMYFQNEDATRGVRYISYKHDGKPDVLDELWHHDVDPFLSIDYRDYDSLDANGRYLAKCPKYAAIDEKFDEAIFDSETYCERCSMSEKFYIDYELYQQIDKGLDEILNEQQETIPENQEVLNCMYEGENGKIIISQDSKGNLTAKYGKNCPNTALSSDECFIEIPKDSAAIDVDKFETNSSILTEYGTLKTCSDRIAFYTDEFGIYHFELGVGTYKTYVPQNITITPVDPEVLDCNSLLGSPKIQGQPAFYLQIVFDVMKYVAIAIVIIFSILDFTGAVASQDNDAIKKSTKKLIIRLVLCVVIFVLPTILEFVFTLIDVYSPSTCRIN